MSRLSLYVGSLLYILQCHRSLGFRLENKTLQIGDKLTLTTPNFPSCCATDFRFTMSCKSNNCGLKIHFLDVSLPESSTLTIRGKPGSPSNPTPDLGQAQFVDGSWTRPSLVYEGKEASIVLHTPSQASYPQYSGVKVQIYAYSTTYQKEIADYTSAAMCGRARLQTWSGGEIKVTTSNLKGMMDCIWLIRKPSAAEDANTFVRITYTSDLHGILSIRNGSNSVAPPLFYFDTAEGSTSIMHGREGFTSPGDLFVRLRKPVESGEFTFVYGLFTRLDTADSGGGCIINGLRGFFCAESKWCIPIVDRCDDVKQCPRGEDEKNCEGVERITYKIPTTTEAVTTPVTSTTKRVPTYVPTPTPTPCPYGHILCPDGSCTLHELCPGECYSYQKKCPDGSCVGKYTTCPGECALWQKKCPNNKCISYSSLCPGECRSSKKKCANGECIDIMKMCREELCPSYKPHRCGHHDKCYSDSAQCDGSRDCDNGMDEQDCGSDFPWFIILIVLGVVVMVICIFLGRSKARENAREAGEAGEPAAIAGARTAAPTIAGARSANSSSATTYPSYNATADSATFDTATAATPLAPDAGAPPSYTEALDSDVYHRPAATAPILEPAPPPYESVAATNLPDKNSISPV